MASLDDQASYVRLDLGGMKEHLRQLPEQCRRAWAEMLPFPLPPGASRVDKVVILGMGGSAIGGAMARALLAEHSTGVVWCHNDYGLPAFVDDRTLVIASSYSGNTEETLDGFARALSLPCPKIVITTGGALKERADSNGIPVFTIGVRSQPRAAIGYSLMPLLAILDKLGMAPSVAAWVDDTVETLEQMSSGISHDTPAPSNQAKRMATTLLHHMPVVYGAGPLAPVAYRWKTQINENSKSWAVSEYLPELDHNSVAGYGLPPVFKDLAHVIFLSAPSLHPRCHARYTATAELLDKAGIPHSTLHARGRCLLAHMMSLAWLGDWTSYYLAILNDVDPTPVTAIDYLKSRLKSI